VSGLEMFGIYYPHQQKDETTCCIFDEQVANVGFSKNPITLNSDDCEYTFWYSQNHK